MHAGRTRQAANITRRITAMKQARIRTRKSGLALAAALALGAWPVEEAQAATCTWNTTNGNWNALANWLDCATGNGNPAKTPGSVDTANIGAAGVVTVDTAQSVRNLNNAGQINVDASTLTQFGGGVTVNTGTINVGGTGPATLQMNAGHSITNTGGVINIANASVMSQGGGAIVGGTINTTGSGVLRAVSNANNYLNGVALNGTLDMATVVSSRNRVINGLTLNGTANINNSGILSFEGTQALGGAGSLVFGGSPVTNNRIALDGNGTTTFGANTTVRGENGTIGNSNNIGGTQILVNNGLISADVAGGRIWITTSAVANNHRLEARNGATLDLNSAVTNGASGTILADNGVVLQSGMRVTGGAINTANGGVFRAISNANNYLDATIVNGTLDMATVSGSRNRIVNGLTLNGTANINNGGILSFEGTQALAGTGTIVFGSSAGNRIALDSPGTTTFAAGTTVRGQNGSIGQAINIGGAQTLVNNGTISADVAGGTITINTHPVTNGGTLSALNGGTLVLSSDVTSTGGGQILAGAGSQVRQNGVTIGGTVNTSGNGLFSATYNPNNYLDGVTLNGNLDMASITTSRQRVTAGGLVLNGQIDINKGGILSFEGNGGLSGAGTIVFGGDTGNRIALDSPGTTTFAAGTTVRGQNGTIGQAINIGGAQTLVNNGTISADVAGGTITINTHPVTNGGTLSALNGGTLVLSSDVTSTGGGQILAGAGSQVRQNGVTIGGAVNTSGNGLFSATYNPNNYLDGVTLNGNLDMASITTSRERVTAGGLVLNGQIDINKGGILSFEGNGGLSGVGTIVFGGDTGNRIALDSPGTTTFAAGTTVRGHSGSIGAALNIGGAQTLVNNGTVHADSAGGTITINTHPITNNGLLRASTGTLTVGVPLSGTGTLQVDAAGAMNLANGAKTQGQLAMGAAGAALNLGTGNLTLSGDYTNVGAGTGNAFNRRAGVTGTGQIVAAGDVAQSVTGAAVTNGATTNATLTIGNVRVGANNFAYQIGNTGTTGPTLRGALQTSVNGANLNDARLSGSGVTAANYNAGAPGANSGDQNVVFTAAAAGTLDPFLTGQVLNLRSNFENIADHKLNIVLASGAAAYNAAVGSTTTPVQVADQRVGGSNAAALAISNTAVSGSFSEDLNASLGAIGGDATATGSLSGRRAGTNNTGTGSISVGVNTASAGAKTGVVNLSYETAGAVNGVSNGLGTASVGSQAVTVNGNVYQAAAGQLVSAPLNFGTVQVGQVVTQNLVIRNTANGAAGFVEDLNASFGATNGTGAGLISGSGSLSGILAGNNSTAGNGTMTVSVNTAAAGTVSGGIAVNYTSAGAVAGISNGLGVLGVGSENYGVAGTIETQANVINQASPLANNPAINLGAVRVGAASPTANVSVTNVATVAPQAALNASISSNGVPVTAAGSFGLLTPGATNAAALQVGLNTTTAGNYTGGNAGSATIAFVSDAANIGNCAPNCQLTLASQQVSVSGKVYTQAVGQLTTNIVDFGIVRVGDTVSAKNIMVDNTASTSALNDTLRADLAGVGGPITGGVGVGGIGAQASGNITVGLNTASAGLFSQAGTVSFLSQNPDMADVAAGADGNVQISAQINNLANADFDFLSGLGVLTQAGTDYLLDLGDILIGSNILATLRLDNDVFGPADDLSGLFNLALADDFQYLGWGPIGPLIAGQASGNLGISYTALALGSIQDEIAFNGLSTNAADPSGIAQSRRLLIRANVIDGNNTVPEPGSLALVLAAAVIGAALRRRRGPASTNRKDHA
jgi:hypothetical protein